MMPLTRFRDALQAIGKRPHPKRALREVIAHDHVEALGGLRPESREGPIRGMISSHVGLMHARLTLRTQRVGWV